MTHLDKFAFLQLIVFTENKNKTRCFFPKCILQTVFQYFKILNAKVLIVGGGCISTKDCFIYDWQETVWKKLDVQYPFDITQVSSTKVNCNEVLIGGGFGNDGKIVSACYIYNITNNVFNAVGNMKIPKYAHAFVTLTDGRILCFGGNGYYLNRFDKIEIYDTSTRTWSLTKLKMTVKRSEFTAVVLRNNSVLICGGALSCEIFDTLTMTFRNVASMNTVREGHAAVLLPNGDVFVTGGYNSKDDNLNTCEIYSPFLDVWSDAPSMHEERVNHGCVLLPNNTVMVIGGFGVISFQSISSCEIFTLSSQQWHRGKSMIEPCQGFAYSLVF